MTTFARNHLVSTDWLAAGLAAGDDLRVFDTTVHLRRGEGDAPYRVESGRADYQAAHIPGAGFLDLQEDLSDNNSALRFTLPDGDRLTAALGEQGVATTGTVVLYSTTNVMWATRIWWMLHSLGYTNARVLDGGLPKWRAEDRPTEAGSASYPACRVTGTLDQQRWSDKAEMLANIGDGAVCTINALTADMHAGTAATHYGRPGHIAGSTNVPYSDVLQADGTFRPAPDVAAAFERVVRDPSQRVVCYCGGGIAATADAFMLNMLGYDNVAVYDGSMSEWVADPEAPMATGNA